MNCKNFKIKTKKGIKYFYCTNTKQKIEYNTCKTCSNKSFKEVKKKVYKRPKHLITSNETYNKVYERDKGQCALCGKRDIQLHHIKGRGKYLTNNIDNCIMLCSIHHDLVHSNKKKYTPILQDIRKEIK